MHCFCRLPTKGGHWDLPLRKPQNRLPQVISPGEHSDLETKPTTLCFPCSRTALGGFASNGITVRCLQC